MTTIMQPFQCNLPPQLQETHRTTHTGTTTRCKTHRRNNSRQKRPQPHPPHRRGTFHRRLQPLYTEKHEVSCSGFLPQHSPCNIHAAAAPAAQTRYLSSPAAATLHGKTQGFVLRLPRRNRAHATFMQPLQFHRRLQPLYTEKPTRFRAPASSPQHSPCNIHAATTMRFAASRSKPAPIYGRGNTKWQQSCSHSNAICHHSFKKRIELRTQEQPLVAKHIGGTIRDRNDRSRTRRTDEVPFIAGCSHFTRKNTRFRAPASSPQHSPCNIHAAITLRFAASRSKPAPIYERGNTKWQQSCSHSNAICHHSFKKRIELRTQE